MWEASDVVSEARTPVSPGPNVTPCVRELRLIIVLILGGPLYNTNMDMIEFSIQAF